MTRYRVEGVVGEEDIRVMTEWFDESEGHVRGVEIGLKVHGWDETEVVSEDTDA